MVGVGCCGTSKADYTTGALQLQSGVCVFGGGVVHQVTLLRTEGVHRPGGSSMLTICPLSCCSQLI
jgi:hypothetical protein